MVVSRGEVKDDLVEFVGWVGFEFFDLLFGVNYFLTFNELSQRVRGALDNGALVFGDFRDFEYLAVCGTDDDSGIGRNESGLDPACEESAESLKGVKRVNNLIENNMILFSIEGKKLPSEKLGDFDFTNLLGSFGHLYSDFFWFGHGVVEKLDDEEEGGEEGCSGIFGKAID